MSSKKSRVRLLLLLALMNLAGSLRAGMPLESAGVRFGFPANDNLAFRQVEAFMDFRLPYRFELSTNWFVRTRFDCSAGWLGKNGTDAFIGTAGPVVVLSRKNFPVSFDLGFNPTILSRYQFAATSFGMTLQFTSHAGIDWDVSPHVRLGYRFQHMSNGGLVEPNPGLNLHMFTVSYRF